MCCSLLCKLILVSIVSFVSNDCGLGIGCDSIVCLSIFIFWCVFGLFMVCSVIKCLMVS